MVGMAKTQSSNSINIPDWREKLHMGETVSICAGNCTIMLNDRKQYVYTDNYIDVLMCN